MRKKVTLALIVFFLLSIILPVYGHQNKNKGDKSVKLSAVKKVVEQKNERSYEKEKKYEKKSKGVVRVNGVLIKFDVPPVIKEGRTLVPVRAIANGFKASVEYDAQTSTVTITKGDIVVKLDLINNEMYVNGKKLDNNVAIQLISNRTFVPLRLISEIFGAKVNYNGETGDIDIEENVDEENNTVSESVYGSVYENVYENISSTVHF
ncbi:copper amine oxidase N-terminal domain-containing protein [Caldanaerobius polysaccharolyticus]|uniref:copper amine oxidase N-terminal domain-containing protein n=1 Tax=Caldanaerobius polysaccharolyticus TaxID=44256 RepID=UPI00047B2936|nr:copper amine oxidase N-terminal domain-containing protein [Caldanaerobius polysaccharolyticus]